MKKGDDVRINDEQVLKDLGTGIAHGKIVELTEHHALVRTIGNKEFKIEIEKLSILPGLVAEPGAVPPRRPAEPIDFPPGAILPQAESSETIDALNECIRALHWCMGSEDFQPGGFAHEGASRVVDPALDKARSVVRKLRGATRVTGTRAAGRTER